MEGNRQVTVIDENSKAIQDIVVLPLYKSSYGIGIGPDGCGPWLSSKVFTKPFRFSSGEDLMSKQIQGRGIIIPPVIFIGISKYVSRWIFIRKGYTPITVDESIIYGDAPIVMIRSNNEENKEYINLLLSKNPDQDELKKIFKAGDLEGDIKLDLDTKDVSLFKSNL